MAKKPYKMTLEEQLDTFIPIVAVCWILVFTYISAFIASAMLAKITVIPVFFLCALYATGSAIFNFKKVEILKKMGKDTSEEERKRHKKAPKLNVGKLVIAGICLALGVLLCIFL